LNLLFCSSRAYAHYRVNLHTNRLDLANSKRLSHGGVHIALVCVLKALSIFAHWMH